jgi:hypothetical protein
MNAVGRRGADRAQDIGGVERSFLESVNAGLRLFLYSCVPHWDFG